MSKQTRAFSSWMIGVSIASVIAWIAVLAIAYQFIEGERAAYRELERLRSEANQPVLPAATPSEFKEPIGLQRASEFTKRWENILAQMSHPYYGNQLGMFMDVPYVVNDASSRVPVEAPKVVWSELPASVAKFVANNRSLIDSIHEFVMNAPEGAIWSGLGSGGLTKVCNMIFLDGVDSCNSGDSVRFHKALDSLVQLRRSLSVGVPLLLEQTESMVCLMHLGLDHEVLSVEEAKRWLDRIDEKAREYAIPSGIVMDRQALFRQFDSYTEQAGFRGFPSMQLTGYERFEAKELRDSRDPFLGQRQILEKAALKYATLAVRVAVTDAVEKNVGDAADIERVARQVRLPKELQSFASRLSQEQILGRFSYEQKSPSQGELRFNLPFSETDGTYPVRESYLVEVKTQ